MRLAILGAGGHGRVVADAAALSGAWSEIVFFDDNYPDYIQSGRWQVIGSSVDLVNTLTEQDAVIIGIGSCDIRMSMTDFLQEKGANLVTVIHPSAIISPDSSIGYGCVILANAVVNTGVSVDNAVIINTAATVDHDCQLDSGVHISPGAHLAGQVVVGKNSSIGIGAVIKQQVKIGCNVTVGAGAAVVNDIPDGQTVAGVPAREL